MHFMSCQFSLVLLLQACSAASHDACTSGFLRNASISSNSSFGTSDSACIGASLEDGSATTVTAIEAFLSRGREEFHFCRVSRDSRRRVKKFFRSVFDWDKKDPYILVPTIPRACDAWFRQLFRVRRSFLSCHGQCTLLLMKALTLAPREKQR